MSSEVPLLLCSPTSDDRPGGEETSLLLGVMTSGRSRIPVGEREEGGEGERDTVIGEIPEDRRTGTGNGTGEDGDEKREAG